MIERPNAPWGTSKLPEPLTATSAESYLRHVGQKQLTWIPKALRHLLCYISPVFALIHRAFKIFLPSRCIRSIFPQVLGRSSEEEQKMTVFAQWCRKECKGWVHQNFDGSLKSGPTVWSLRETILTSDCLRSAKDYRPLSVWIGTL